MMPYCRHGGSDSGRFDPERGGKAVQFHLKSIVTCFSMVMLLAAAGCGGGGEDSPATPAAIGGPDGGKATTAADSSPSFPQPAGRPTTDPLHPVVEIETSLGNITVQLDAERAPLTVDNFLSYVDSGHYQGTIFHQVIKDYPKVVLCGAFTQDLAEKKALTSVRNEADNGLKNQRATIAMARQADAIDSATCHFFLNLDDNEVLDHQDRTLEGYGYCVFGKVTDGMDVVDKIGGSEVRDTGEFEQIPVRTVMIKSIRRLR